MRAYDLKSFQIIGPTWIDSTRYEIAAKITDGADKALVSLMLRSLLVERFRLAAHHETRDLSFYAMLVAKNGPKFKEASKSDQDAVSASAVVDAGAVKPVLPKMIKGPDGFPEIPPGSAMPFTYQAVVSGSDGILYKLWARHETMQQLVSMPNWTARS
jgi:uncharacterized protein (TIGR03435 family)